MGWWLVPLPSFWNLATLRFRSLAAVPQSPTPGHCRGPPGKGGRKGWLLMEPHPFLGHSDSYIYIMDICLTIASSSGLSFLCRRTIIFPSLYNLTNIYVCNSKTLIPAKIFSSNPTQAALPKYLPNELI